MRRKRNLDSVLFENEESDVNPMESVSNLSDVMLVLVVGLMLALISLWNVDLASFNQAVEVEQGQEVTDTDSQNNDSATYNEEGSYQEYGTVYKDPETGALYMVTD